MEDLVRGLEPGCRVLDLGAGSGSFDYQTTRASVFAADLGFEGDWANRSCFRVQARSQNLAFCDGSFDVIICNHTLEHFDRVQQAVAEIGRVLKPSGHLWAAVPDGSSFDDRLYRFLFQGGGHVNQFDFEEFLQLFNSNAALRPVAFKRLYSGFVYLTAPEPGRLKHYPRRARALLGNLPPRLLNFAVKWFNFTVRLVDRWFGSSLSRYGWAVLFRAEQGSSTERLEEKVADLNVCYCCGAGHPEESLEKHLQLRWFLRTYVCPSCGCHNLFVASRETKKE